MKGEELLIEQKDKIAFLYINRPEKFNALNISLLNKINITLRAISKNDKISALQLDFVTARCFELLVYIWSLPWLRHFSIHMHSA